ncbi:hypothetical protein AB0B86_08365 [Micromonospora sp. NPDC049047]|uniref:hypothetical protein n=1 Tax=Micromonospora sp. NPDC049047 TaxID=3155645 RepID=UPI0033FCA4D8
MQPGQWDPQQPQILDPAIPVNERPLHLRHPPGYDPATGAPIAWIYEQQAQQQPVRPQQPQRGAVYRADYVAPKQPAPAASPPERADTPPPRSAYQPTWRDHRALHWRRWSGVYIWLGSLVIFGLVFLFMYLESTD